MGSRSGSSPLLLCMPCAFLALYQSVSPACFFFWGGGGKGTERERDGLQCSVLADACDAVGERG